MRSLNLKPELLESVYELLRTTPPFSRWRLPPGEEVEFHVVDLKPQFHADYQLVAKASGHHVHRIRVNAYVCRTLLTLVPTIAHEMCHIRQQALIGNRTEANENHGVVFAKLADQVCRWHGFDRGTF